MQKKKPAGLYEELVTPRLEATLHELRAAGWKDDLSDVDPAEVSKEREILTTQARTEGKPDKIIEKMVEGRLRNFFAERVLCEQPFVKDEKTTVGKFAKANKITPVRFIHWQLGRSE